MEDGKEGELCQLSLFLYGALCHVIYADVCNSDDSYYQRLMRRGSETIKNIKKVKDMYYSGMLITNLTDADLTDVFIECSQEGRMDEAVRRTERGYTNRARVLCTPFWSLSLSFRMF